MKNQKRAHQPGCFLRPFIETADRPSSGTAWLLIMTLLAASFGLPRVAAQDLNNAAPAPAVSAPVADLPPGAAEVVRLSQAGTGEDVILAYIHDSTYHFNLTADQILYLRDLGLSSTMISAMLNREHELQGQGQTYTYDQRLYAPANPPPAPVEAAPEVAPQPAGPALAPPQAPPPVYDSAPPPDVNYFYDDLAPYGSWIDLDGVGWCWQPQAVVINHGWRPYCDGGYWVYTDAGWYWQSTYSWGWAPFHYGRWQLHPRCGWVWQPDRVWGPSWVLWRSQGDYCGWAPLPPHALFEAGFGWRFNGVRVGVNFDFGLRPDHYSFVALRDFNNHDLGHRRLPPAEITRIYNHTTIINNYAVNNRTVVNHGIGVDRVAAATHTQIRPVAIRDVPAHSAGMTRTANAGKPGSVVYRRELSAPARRTAMVAQKVDDRHPVVQHAPPASSNTYRAPASVAASRTGSTAGGRTQADAGRTYQPATAQNPAYRQQTTTRQAHPSAPAASTPTYTRPATPTRTEAASRYYPVQTGGESQSRLPGTTRPPSQNNSAGQYYPKSYRQAAEVRALPPENNARPESRAPAQQNAPAQRGH